MMGSINRVTIVGNLGQDPEVRTTNTGALVVSLSVATTDNWTDKQTGEKRQRTEWHRVVIFNQSKAKIARDYLKKGAQVYLEGQLQTRKWTTEDGQDRYSTEVTLQPYHGVLTLLGGGQGHNNPDNADSSQTNGMSNGLADGSTGNGTSMAHDDQIPY
ncbi:MAG: single-stranded DNA-binding protein [Alphaproteobacteria bacterium]|nr:MAG: single-stranded DNA-binding protein [Alphaproteobacteria bacterium]